MNTMTDKEKTDFAEAVDILKSLSRDDLLKTWGFALGLKIKEESKVKSA